MNVNPTQPDSTPRPGTGRLHRALPDPISRPIQHRTIPSIDEQKDAVEISPAAREMSASTGSGDAGAAGLSPERRTEILDRIAQGFYQRPEVRAEVLRRMGADLANPLP